MHVSRRMRPAFAGAALLSLFLLAYVLSGATSAQAAGPATVSVRVVGSGNQTLVPLTEVTTNETSVVNDGDPEHSCAGTSAAGALQLATEATKGSWSGTWSNGLGYFVDTIDGMAPPGQDYWSLWLNDEFSNVGMCDAQLESGEQILFLPQCEEEVKAEEFVVCKNSPSLLAIEVPATVEVHEPVPVTVLAYPDPSSEPKPAEGVIVEGGGDSSAPPTNAQGKTTLVFAGDGKYTIQAIGTTEPRPIPAEAFVCAHEGNDGTCGTQVPGNSPGVKSSPGSGGTIINSGPLTIETAKIAGVKNNHVYSRRTAPRLLKGSVVVPAGGLLQKVQISLKRRYHGRCYGFDGSAVRFVAIKCRRAASFFSVGTEASFSYLLPARLPKGSYTYDIEAVNGTGQPTKLVSGISHVVFQVK
jgi:hypothetical protein